jgi:hypothetical protein
MNSNLCTKCSVKYCKRCENDNCTECIESYEFQKNECNPKNDYSIVLMSIGLGILSLIFMLCFCCIILKYCNKNRRNPNVINIVHN